MKIDGEEVKLWKGLHYWKTGECQVVTEKLKELTKSKIRWCPGPGKVYRALDCSPLEMTKVCILGQDPYPDPEFATGLAFDIGSNPVYPPSMRTILKELRNDLDIIHTGNLCGWATQGVLLWNCIPTCEAGKSMSHDWVEWEPLTLEILSVLNKRNIVFVLVGSHSKHFRHIIDEDENEIIYVDHPAAWTGSTPFAGSRLFSTINTKLVELGHGPVDWKL
jgi:uracil-DNA glycosylase